MNIAEKYYFNYIDAGYAHEQTPLFSGVVDDKQFCVVLAEELREFSPGQIIKEIEYARREVDL